MKRAIEVHLGWCHVVTNAIIFRFPITNELISQLTNFVDEQKQMLLFSVRHLNKCHRVHVQRTYLWSYLPNSGSENRCLHYTHYLKWLPVSGCPCPSKDKL